jgi:hypothetical protein
MDGIRTQEVVESAVLPMGNEVNLHFHDMETRL